MTRPRQEYCQNVAEHDAHDGMIICHAGGSRVDMIPVRCPGRFTPRLRGVGVSGDPRQPEDPFEGIE